MFDILRYPCEDVEEPVHSERSHVMPSNVFTFLALLDHVNLRDDRQRFKPNGEAPAYLKYLVFSVIRVNQQRKYSSACVDELIVRKAIVVRVICEAVWSFEPNEVDHHTSE